jgi:hypothetical protein
MKRVIVILFMILAVANLLQAAVSSSKFDSPSILGPDGAVFFKPGTDAKRVEDKMAEALVRLDSWKRARGEENSTRNNISINSSLSNSSLLNSSANENVASSFKGSFNGYYGMTASRHEMGKSGIDSRMFLNGTFEMDKTVKFQDQGF